MSTAPAFASATDALEVVRAGLRFLATADAAQMTAAERAACLRGLEKADAAATAARTSVLGARRGSPGGPGRAGRRGDLEVLRPGDLPVGRQAPRRRPRGRG